MYSSCTAVYDILQYLTAKLLYIPQLKLLYNCCTSKKFSDFACLVVPPTFFSFLFHSLGLCPGRIEFCRVLEQFSFFDFLRKRYQKTKNSTCFDRYFVAITFAIVIANFGGKKSGIFGPRLESFFSGSGPTFNSALKPVAAF